MGRQLQHRRTVLRMSDMVPDEETSFWKPPPPPEDRLILTGDLAALFVYGFTDHFLCSDIGNYFIQQADSPQKLHLAADSTQTTLNTPVWIEPESVVQLTKTMQLQLSETLVSHYSPVLQPTGMATCLLAGSWLLAGWLHHAFSFQNTLNCRTDRALQVTATAWVTSCGIMLSIVSISHLLCGCDVFYTRGDVDYIFDSLSVLCMWRFLASSILGNAQD